MPDKSGGRAAIIVSRKLLLNSLPRPQILAAAALADMQESFHKKNKKKLDISLRTCYNNSVEFKSEIVTNHYGDTNESTT